MIIFTRQCSGDLGVIIDSEVVTMIFERFNPDTGATFFNVHDIRKGGEPIKCATLIRALDEMEHIAQRVTKS